MRAATCALALAGPALMPEPGLAADETAPTRATATETIIIYGKAWDAAPDRVSEDVLDAPRFMNVGEAIANLPGVGAVRRAESATEPVIRGLGWERVSTQIGHMPIYGACPSRMDPPITYVKPHAVRQVRVIKGLGSVTLGPGGTGGRIIVENDYQRTPGSPSEMHGDLRLATQTARESWGVDGALYGGNEWLDVMGTLETAHYGDYESGNGTRVPANQDEYSAGLSLGVRPTLGHRWSNTLNYVREEDVDFPALPMDIAETDYWTYTTGYRIEDAWEVLDRVEFDGGYMNIHHVMNNENKSNRGMLEAETPSDSVGYSGRLAVEQQLSATLDLAAGLDFQLLERDALRTRTMQMGPLAGRTFRDRIWPDARQSDLGGFAELTLEPTADWTLRLGGRVDHVDSSAGAADASSLGGMTVEEAWVSFYGPGAANFDRTETLGSGNAIVQWFFARGASTHLGVGMSTRAAGVTERYFAFAPAPGGFLVGNPSLDAEKKTEIEWGVDWRAGWGALSLAAYHSWIDDYILQTRLEQRDVDGDGNPDLIRGFENVEARLYGFEAALTLDPTEYIRIPLALSYTRGRNSSDDRDLPEIPPLEGQAAIVGNWYGDWPGWLEVGGRFAASQKKVDEQFPEDESPSFAVLHVRASVEIFEQLELVAGIENLLDTEYHEHLTREAFFPAGDLLAGDEVPAPGRSFHVALTASF